MIRCRVKNLVNVGILSLAGIGVSGCQPNDSMAQVGEPETGVVETSNAISGENGSGDNLGGTNLGGANLGGSNLGGANLAGANLGGRDLGGANGSGSNLAGANLGGTNLGGANLGGANLAGSNLGGANLAGANLGGANLAGSNLAGSNLSGSNFAPANFAGSTVTGTTLRDIDLLDLNSGKDIHLTDDTAGSITRTGTWTAATDGHPFGGSYRFANSTASMTLPFTGVRASIFGWKCTYCGIMRIKIDGVAVAQVDTYGTSAWRQETYTTPVLSQGSHTLTIEWTGTKNAAATGNRIVVDAFRIARGGSQLLLSGEDLFHVDQKASASNSSCVVMGLGSTAFSRLVTANTGYNLYALVGKLPWGFSKTTGGEIELAAWEVIVWGTNTYCTFVVPAPVGATYEGVGGFVKAVFRWNAPPAKLITIGQIGGGRDTKTYYGMMNAAARFMNGTLSAHNLIAGELSFVTATTNNITVNVDFASYVQLVDGSWAVLGNPTVLTGTTQYAEGSFVTVPLDDGHHVVSFAPQTSLYYDVLGQAYDAYLAGVATQPEAKRCLGARYLLETRSVPGVSLKCDTGVSFRDLDFADGDNKINWADLPGAVSNVLTRNLVVAKGANFSGGTFPAVAGTHVFVNELPYRLKP